MQGDSKLDNPVWYSLSECHKDFSIDYNNIKFYHPGYCVFGGFKTAEEIAGPIDAYSSMTDNFFIVGERPELSDRLLLKKELVCLQMVIEHGIDKGITEDIILLDNSHTRALLQLVNLVQPGYFCSKTALLGNYYGIFRQGELIAVAGERMKMNRFVEVSAVITHPAHTRQGYATQLIAHTVNNIFHQNRNPYLHVVESNTAAIALYQKMGFTVRRKISFWNITKQNLPLP